jgi:hypothetical protein
VCPQGLPDLIARNHTPGGACEPIYMAESIWVRQLE